MTDFDLSSFLADQAAEGVSRGSGDFTISHEKAARKMAEYSLPREHAWVLKLIQAGVGWGCEGCKITQTRLHSTFHFQFSNFQTLPTNQELVTAILRADLESHAPLNSFAMGLRLMVEKSYLSFLLLIDTPETESQAIYAGVYFAELEEEKRANLRRNWTSGVTLMIHHIEHTNPNRLLINYIPIERHGLPIFKELTGYAFTCPVPLTLDGRRIDGVFRCGRFAWSSNFKPLRAAGMEIPGQLVPRFLMSPGFDNQVFGLFTPLAKLAKLDQGSSANAFLLLAADNEFVRFPTHAGVERSTLFWVRNGVVVDRELLPTDTRMTKLYIFASAEDLRTDLTGFHLLRDAARLERAERVLRRAAQVLGIEKKAARNLMERPPEVIDMASEQLEDLPAPARVVARGLHVASQALEKDSSELERLRAFAKRLVKGAYEAVQVAVYEVDNWTPAGFIAVYPSELDDLINALLEVDTSTSDEGEQL